MNKLIFVENYVFDMEWFHSAGIKRIDTRTKEQRAEALAAGKAVTPSEWPVTLQLYIKSPDLSLRVLNFQSREGEEATVGLFIDVLGQLGGFSQLGGCHRGTRGEYKGFLMEDLQIKPQARPGEEKGDGQRDDKQGEGGNVQEPPTGGDKNLPGGAGGGSDGDSDGGVQGDPGGDTGGDEQREPRPQDYRPTGSH